MSRKDASHALSAAALRSPKKRAGSLVRRARPANKFRTTRSSLTLNKFGSTVSKARRVAATFSSGVWK